MRWVESGDVRAEAVMWWVGSGDVRPALSGWRS